MYLNNQLYSKNMSMLFKSITTALIFSICSLIFSSSSIKELMDRSFKVFNTNKTKNEEVTRFIILSSFTSCLLILVWIHSKLTSTLSCNFFLFYIFIFVYTLSSSSLLFLLCRIIYWFFIIIFFIVWFLLYTSALYLLF